MASCTQVEAMFQAWIDNELGQAERVIFEQHTAECAACAAALKQHQRNAASLFESLAEYRLRHNLRRHVLDHLPEMEPGRLNPPCDERPDRFWFLRQGLVARLAALAAVVVLAVFLWIQWPQGKGTAGVLGVVTFSNGSVACRDTERAVADKTELSDYVAAGNSFETGEDSRLMLNLRGPTELKAAANTLVKVSAERYISVDRGRVWLSVAKSSAPFRIMTPTGEVRVLGTILDVSVDALKTVVTVREGHVVVRNSIGEGDVSAGQQIEVKTGEAILDPRPIDAKTETRWAEDIRPDPAASEVFLTAVQAEGVTPLRAEQVFVIRTNNGQGTRTVPSFVISWPETQTAGDRCSYYVYVYNDAMVELFSTHIDGTVFAEQERQSLMLPVPSGSISGVDVIHIKVVPDFSTGGVETQLDISALSI